MREATSDEVNAGRPHEDALGVRGGTSGVLTQPERSLLNKPTEQDEPLLVSRGGWRIVVWASLLVVTALGFAQLMSLGLVNPPDYREKLVPSAALFTLPQFELIDHQGQPFGSKQLEGRVWIASFFFTSCPSICPTLMARTRVLHDALPEVQMVSLSVDPKTDTPEVLRMYAQKMSIQTDRWSLLTGDPGVLENVIVEGFKQAMGDPSSAAAKGLSGFDIAHGVRWVLVDAELGVRGLYETDNKGLKRLVSAVQQLTAGRAHL